MNFARLFKNARTCADAAVTMLMLVSSLLVVMWVMSVVATVSIWGYFMLPYILTATPAPESVRTAYNAAMEVLAFYGGVPVATLLIVAFGSLVIAAGSAVVMFVSSYVLVAVPGNWFSGIISRARAIA
jgi:hypothetical protein